MTAGFRRVLRPRKIFVLRIPAENRSICQVPRSADAQPRTAGIEAVGFVGIFERRLRLQIIRVHRFRIRGSHISMVEISTTGGEEGAPFPLSQAFRNCLCAWVFVCDIDCAFCAGTFCRRAPTNHHHPSATCHCRNCFRDGASRNSRSRNRRQVILTRARERNRGRIHSFSLRGMFLLANYEHLTTLTENLIGLTALSTNCCCCCWYFCRRQLPTSRQGRQRRCEVPEEI